MKSSRYSAYCEAPVYPTFENCTLTDSPPSKPCTRAGPTVSTDDVRCHFNEESPTTSVSGTAGWNQLSPNTTHFPFLPVLLEQNLFSLGPLLGPYTPFFTQHMCQHVGNFPLNSEQNSNALLWPPSPASPTLPPVFYRNSSLCLTVFLVFTMCLSF